MAVSLATNALTTLATVLDELGLTSDNGGQDDRVKRYINVASDLFEQKTNRRWYWNENYIESVASTDNARLVVSDHLPIDTVDSIKWEDGDTSDTIDSTNYEIEDAAKGFIRRIDGTWSSTERTFAGMTVEALAGSEEYLWKVTYDGGYVTPQQDADDATLTRDLPWDVEDAIVQAVATRWRLKGRDGTIKSKKLLSASVTYMDGVPVGPAFVSAVKRYRSVGIA